MLAVIGHLGNLQQERSTQNSHGARTAHLWRLSNQDSWVFKQALKRFFKFIFAKYIVGGFNCITCTQYSNMFTHSFILLPRIKKTKNKTIYIDTESSIAVFDTVMTYIDL